MIIDGAFGIGGENGNGKSSKVSKVMVTVLQGENNIDVGQK